jgi:hypothetical protein
LELVELGELAFLPLGHLQFIEKWYQERVGE